MTTAPTITGANDSAEVGGISVFASENYRLELIKTAIGSMEIPDTTLTANVKTTSGTSPLVQRVLLQPQLHQPLYH